ncbi:MAG: hypothetical protein RLZZ113_1134 [Pseudomonadota bacterium]
MTTPLEAIEGLWLAQAMRHSLWLYPTVETLHLWGIGLLFGSVVLMDLRVLGLAKEIDFASLSRCLAMITGLLMFTTHASEFVGMRLFVIKMILITLLLTNAIALRAQSVANGEHSGFVKLQALISIIGWASVIGAGRWLAYT